MSYRGKSDSRTSHADLNDEDELIGAFTNISLNGGSQRSALEINPPTPASTITSHFSLTSLTFTPSKKYRDSYVRDDFVVSDTEDSDKSEEIEELEEDLADSEVNSEVNSELDEEDYNENKETGDSEEDQSDDSGVNGELEEEDDEEEEDDDDGNEETDDSEEDETDGELDGELDEQDYRNGFSSALELPKSLGLQRRTIMGIAACKQDHVVYIARSKHKENGLTRVKVGRTCGSERRQGEYQECGLKIWFQIPVVNAHYVEKMAHTALKNEYFSGQSRIPYIQSMSEYTQVQCPCGKSHNRDVFLTTRRGNHTWLKNLLRALQSVDFHEAEVLMENQRAERIKQISSDRKRKAGIPTGEAGTVIGDTVHPPKTMNSQTAMPERARTESSSSSSLRPTISTTAKIPDIINPPTINSQTETRAERAGTELRPPSITSQNTPLGSRYFQRNPSISGPAPSQEKVTAGLSQNRRLSEALCDKMFQPLPSVVGIEPRTPQGGAAKTSADAPNDGHSARTDFGPRGTNSIPQTVEEILKNTPGLVPENPLTLSNIPVGRESIKSKVNTTITRQGFPYQPARGYSTNPRTIFRTTNTVKGRMSEQQGRRSNIESDLGKGGDFVYHSQQTISTERMSGVMGIPPTSHNNVGPSASGNRNYKGKERMSHAVPSPARISSTSRDLNFPDSRTSRLFNPNVPTLQEQIQKQAINTQMILKNDLTAIAQTGTTLKSSLESSTPFAADDAIVLGLDTKVYGGHFGHIPTHNRKDENLFKPSTLTPAVPMQSAATPSTPSNPKSFMFRPSAPSVPPAFIFQASVPTHASTNTGRETVPRGFVFEASVPNHVSSNVGVQTNPFKPLERKPGAVNTVNPNQHTPRAE